MKTLKIEDGDICFNEDKSLIMTDGDNETAQAVERALTTDLGEWFLNGNHGLDYAKIRGKNVSDEVIKAEIIRAATQDARVQEIISINIQRQKSSRHVDIRFTCRLDSNEVVNVDFGL